jgi:hypothetical protein
VNRIREIRGGSSGGYESLANERDDLTLIGCWAHTRRGFHEALSESKVSAWFVRQIGLLYAVEKDLRKKKAGPQLRVAMRVWQSRPVLKRLRRAMELVRGRTLPQGLLGQAIDYALKRWEALTRFVDDGVLEIDNNLIENVIPSFGLRSLCRDANNAEFKERFFRKLKNRLFLISATRHYLYHSHERMFKVVRLCQFRTRGISERFRTLGVPSSQEFPRPPGLTLAE